MEKFYLKVGEKTGINKEGVAIVEQDLLVAVRTYGTYQDNITATIETVTGLTSTNARNLKFQLFTEIPFEIHRAISTRMRHERELLKKNTVGANLPIIQTFLRWVEKHLYSDSGIKSIVSGKT